MNPRDRMEKAIALGAIADVAEQMEQSGASGMDVAAFSSGARQELTKQRPDPEKYAQAAVSAAKWARTNM